MEPTLNSKRRVALFIPYRKDSAGTVFFLQMRDENAPSHPSMYSIFGGGIDGEESHRDAVLREIREELVYTPQNLTYFLHSEMGTRICELYIEEVSMDFESQIEVKEGKYGKFLSMQEIEQTPHISFLARMFTAEINAWLTNVPL